VMMVSYELGYEGAGVAEVEGRVHAARARARIRIGLMVANNGA